MARGRMLDRNVMKSRKVNSLSRDHRLMYVSMLPFLDREGRIVAEPIVLKANVFRWSDFTVDEIAEGVAALAAAELVELYSDEDNDAIIQYTRFADFNSPNAKEAKSEVIGPDDPKAQPCRDECICASRTVPMQCTCKPPALPVENETSTER